MFVAKELLPHPPRSTGRSAGAVLALLILGLAVPSATTAAAPTSEASAVTAAATGGNGLEALPATGSAPVPPTEATSEVAPPPAEVVPPPVEAPPAEAPVGAPAPPPSSSLPSPRPQEIVEDVAATVEPASRSVESVTRSSLPSDPQQQVEGLTREAREGVAEVVDRAAGKSEAVLDAAVDTAQGTGSHPVDLTRPLREATSTVLGSPVLPPTVLPPATEILPPTVSKKSPSPLVPIDPGSTKPEIGSPSIGGPTGLEDQPVAALPGTAATTLPHPAPAATLVSIPTAPILEVPAPPVGQDGPGRASPTEIEAGFYGPASSIAQPQTAGSADSAGASAPAAPASPSPALPDALGAGAGTTAPGGGGSILLWALLTLSILQVPTFASKLRMHAGDCRPAPFVSLLERPG